MARVARAPSFSNVRSRFLAAGPRPAVGAARRRQRRGSAARARGPAYLEPGALAASPRRRCSSLSDEGAAAEGPALRAYEAAIEGSLVARRRRRRRRRWRPTTSPRSHRGSSETSRARADVDGTAAPFGDRRSARAERRRDAARRVFGGLLGVLGEVRGQRARSFSAAAPRPCATAPPPRALEAASAAASACLACARARAAQLDVAHHARRVIASRSSAAKPGFSSDLPPPTRRAGRDVRRAQRRGV